MSDHTLGMIWMTGWVIFALGTFTVAGIKDDPSHAAFAILGFAWPFVAAVLLVSGFVQAWMLLAYVVYHRIRPEPPTPDEYVIAAEREVERLTLATHERTE